jgi:DNA polymerase (family X)
MKNRDVLPLITMLDDFATMLDLLGENSFKIRAIQTAARALEGSGMKNLDVEALATLATLQGFGKGMVQLAREYVEIGSIIEFAELQKRVPADVLAITRLRGLGAKKVRQLWQENGITSITALEAAAQAGRVATMKGFGAKTQESILETIRQYRTAQGLYRVHTAWAEAERVQEILRSNSIAGRVEIAGTLRQGAETVSEIVVLVEELSPSNGPNNVPETAIPCRFEYATPDTFALRLHELSSEPDFHNALLSRASTGNNEQELYASIGAPYVPPELRFKAEYLTDKTLQAGLADIADGSRMRGLLHTHSTWSDGKNTIGQMADTARARGYEYIAMCDHSKTAFYANGLTEERVKRQHDEIDVLNEELRSQGSSFRILKGIESDILPDGSLDYNDAVLETFEVVVASVHSGFTLSREDQTNRIVRALEHPATTLLGHPTGRLLLSRAGYELDMDAVFEAARQNNKAIEINANPHRLDLSWNHAQKAHQMGILLAINTDAHNCDALGYMRYGLSVARRAGVSNAGVINTFGVDELLRFCRS